MDVAILGTEPFIKLRCRLSPAFLDPIICSSCDSWVLPGVLIGVAEIRIESAAGRALGVRIGLEGRPEGRSEGGFERGLEGALPASDGRGSSFSSRGSDGRFLLRESLDPDDNMVESFGGDITTSI